MTPPAALTLLRDTFLDPFVQAGAYALKGFAHPSPTPQDCQAQLGETLGSLPSGPTFLTAKIPAAATAWGWALARTGFFLADTLVGFETRQAISPGPSPIFSVTAATPADQTAVTALARQSFVHSRFHQDPFIPMENANHLKGQWLENFFHGQRGDALLLAKKENQLAGFVLLLAPDGDTLVVDEIAVDERFRGQGVGRLLLAHAQRLYPKKSVLSAGTQLVNQTSVGFYLACGFTPQACWQIYHRHSNHAGGPA